MTDEEKRLLRRLEEIVLEHSHELKLLLKITSDQETRLRLVERMIGYGTAGIVLVAWALQTIFK